MEIHIANLNETVMLLCHDRHISEEELKNSIRLGRVYIIKEHGNFAGWLRYNLFWDNTPFMNMLYISKAYRNKGHGRQLLEFWENEMKQKGFKTVMTSTQSDELAQHFYVHCGYEAVGGFRLNGDPYELIFSKRIDG